jgi:hypothetical protein
MVSIGIGDESNGAGLMFMACFSVGVHETCSLALALVLPTEDVGAALGALGSIRYGGASVAAAIFVAILTNMLTAFTAPAVTVAALQASLPKSSVPALLADLVTGDFSNFPDINDGIIAAVGHATAQAAVESFRYIPQPLLLILKIMY